MADFGVTASDVQQETQGLVLTATSTPTLARVEEIIEQATAEVTNEMIAKEIAIPTEDSVGASRNTYLLAQSMTLALTCSRVLTARDRGGSEASSVYRDRYLDSRNTLRRLPSMMAPNRAPGVVNAARTLRQENPAVPTTIAGRLARSRRGL